MTQQSFGNLTLNSQPAKNPQTEFFKVIIRDSGIKLISTDGPNVLTQEQALVVRDIDKFLDPNPDENIDKFLKGFRILIKKEKYMEKALLHSVFKKTRENGTDVLEQQESLFRILLKVHRLQNEIIEMILEEITSTISDENPEIPKLRLLLSQLWYLPHIKSPQNLTTKLLDIIDVAPFTSQLEILASIPEILPDSEYNDAAEELMKMLDKNDDLAGAIIDCLNALGISSEIRSQVQDHILSKILTGTSTKIFPIFLDFLLSDCNAKTLPGILMKIRNSLNVILSDKSNKEKESEKIVVFNRLQKSAVSKIVFESWMSVISNIKTHVDHKPVDLIILFMLHSETKLKKRAIEITFRKRIKDGQFKCTLLEQMFEKYLPSQLLRDYFPSIVEIASCLLRSSEDAVICEFASTLFKLLFTNQHTERICKQELLETMIILIGSSDQKNVTQILKIIVDLLDEITSNHAVILMRLLEKIDTFELHEVHLVFEILCKLTCYDETLLGLKEELHMVVRKHLTSSTRSMKFRGIISAVVMAKHIATVEDDDSENSEESITSLNQLTGNAKEAAAILELTTAAAAESPEFLSLYYDQLGSMLVKNACFDRHFLSWLFEAVTCDFTALYVAETEITEIGELEVSTQYNLNSSEEMEATFAVNIAELTLKSEKIQLLAPHFRLLRLLHFKHQNGDLSSIDALLGCGVVLPKFEQRDNAGIEDSRQMVDCLFHCINWFRETISGFAAQKKPALRAKVLQRLDNLHELQELLTEVLENVPNHKFHSYSERNKTTISPVKEIKVKTKKRKKDETAPSTSAVKSPKKIKNENEIKFREIDTDIVKLLKYPLDSNAPLHLNINQLNFILKDYVTKLSTLLKKRDTGLSNLSIVAPLEVITDSSKVLLNLNEHFKVILKKLPDANMSFGLILDVLCLIFSWSGFQHTKRIDLLRDILKSFREESSTPLNSVSHLTSELIRRLSSYAEYCADLNQAVALIKTMEALFILSPSNLIRSRIAKTAGMILNKKWDSHSAINIDVLIAAYLSSASIKTICGMVGTLQDEIPNLTEKTSCLDMLKSVTKSNFYILYRNLWSSLQERIKSDVQSLTNSQHLTLWRTTALTMQGLMTIAKTQESKLNLVCFLKKSIAILKIFLSHGIPILEIELKFEPDRVCEIFKTIQGNTRFLHHLCCYSKLMKDASLMSYVPQFRLTLETLVYRVKAALVANGCSEAFWMGNLRNRDLEGEDIASQSTEQSREEEGDEEMPSDEDLNEEDVSNAESEVFG